jgi:hypothetical protein
MLMLTETHSGRRSAIIRQHALKFQVPVSFQLGSASGDVPPLDLMKLASLGSLYVTRPVLRDYALTQNELVDRATEVFRAVVSGALKLRMERTYSFSEAAQAHRDLESRKTAGKLLLIPSGYGRRIDSIGPEQNPRRNADMPEAGGRRSSYSSSCASECYASR